MCFSPNETLQDSLSSDTDMSVLNTPNGVTLKSTYLGYFFPLFPFSSPSPSFLNTSFVPGVSQALGIHNGNGQSWPVGTLCTAPGAVDKSTNAHMRATFVGLREARMIVSMEVKEVPRGAAV